MKPNEANAKYCLKNAKFVNGLLEGRGWQDGDWVWLNGRPQFISRVNEDGNVLIHSGWHVPEAGAIWLPSEGDLLAMLADEGFGSLSWGHTTKHHKYQCSSDASRQICGGPTLLIALLELLRTVEDEG